MTRSYFPSTITIGRTKNKQTVSDFLCARFPEIPPSVWLMRIKNGSVLYENGSTVQIQDTASAGTKIFYYREVETETVIPFKEKILFMDEHILAADKPHFLAVTPAGRYVNETLLNRLRKSTGINDMVPVNRLDRETAGIVLFSINKQSRNVYYTLFRERLVHKTYKAVSAGCMPELNRWRIENRLVPGNPWFRMKCSECNDNGSNAVTEIILDKCGNGFCFFTLYPETGQKHQLRVHMALIGYPVLNDRFYPLLMPEEEDDFSKPLKLLAEKLAFKDPLTGRVHEFQSEHLLFP